jgi:hypothetical protein
VTTSTATIVAHLDAAAAVLSVVHPTAACRIERAVRIVRADGVSRMGAGVWLVASESNPDHAYAIVPVGALLTCDCADARQRGLPCKHTLSVQLYLACERIDAETTDPTLQPIPFEITEKGRAARAALDADADPMPAA